MRKERKQVTKRGAARPPGPAYWLITRNENGRIEVLTIHLGEGEEALALFSFEEEAQMYLGFEASGVAGGQGRPGPGSSYRFSSGVAHT